MRAISRRLPRIRPEAVSPSRLQLIELLIGPNGPSIFPSVEARQALWDRLQLELAPESAERWWYGQKSPKDYCAVAEQYARDVVGSAIPACRWVQLACQRQLDDLAKPQGAEWPWSFDRVRGNRICRFLEMLPHVKGRWKSPTLTLEPHQCFRFSTIFGWVDSEGFRRFRKVLNVMPRKNAKTTEAAGVGLYLFGFDGEPGAEVYSAATTRDQAKICWDQARRMILRSPLLRERGELIPLAHSIIVESEAACFKPLSRDADSLEGLSPSAAIIDELHAHKTREVFDVLDEATGSRRQPLLFIISTEGDNATGVFAEQVSYCQDVLAGVHRDRATDSYFGIIYTIDEKDDWTDPASWCKANPNMGVSVFETDLAVRCQQAQKNAQSQASFLTKRLNIRVGAGNAFFNLFAWNTICRDVTLKLGDFVGKPCLIGLDLASKKDLAAKVLLFEDAVFAHCYLPEDAAERGNPNYDRYLGWAEKELLTLTSGNITDFAFIERDLLEDVKRFQVQQVGFDPSDASQFYTRMEAAGVPMVEVVQNISKLSEPMKELDARIISGRIKHDGNPMLAWMIGNVIGKKNAYDDVFPVKQRNESKIDGAVALIIAESLRLRMQDDTIEYTGGFAS